jgi:hypothetical protein
MLWQIALFFVAASLHAAVPESSECGPQIKASIELAKQGIERTRSRHRSPTNLLRPAPACAVILFTLTEDGSVVDLEVLIASSIWIERYALDMVSRTRFSEGDRERVALIVEVRAPNEAGD